MFNTPLFPVVIQQREFKMCNLHILLGLGSMKRHYQMEIRLTCFIEPVCTQKFQAVGEIQFHTIPPQNNYDSAESFQILYNKTEKLIILHRKLHALSKLISKNFNISLS